ncbi:MAG: hypothetical protein OEW70_03235 [candidate division WOR-3 bacterium]|nr:hypothetical protein [candidate division WOR-3 bacterium]
MKNFLILSAIALTISLTFADTLSLPVGQVTVIRSGAVNRIRVLFDISTLQNARVDYAEILIPHFLNEGEIVLEGWRLISENPDDYDTTFHARYTTEASVNLPVILDITDFMKYWVGNSNNFGVLLKRPYYQGGGFRGELQNLMNALTNARIRVFFICESE